MWQVLSGLLSEVLGWLRAISLGFAKAFSVHRQQQESIGKVKAPTRASTDKNHCF